MDKLTEETIQNVAQKIGSPVEEVREAAKTFEQEVEALRSLTPQEAVAKLDNLLETIDKLSDIFMRNVRELLSGNALIAAIFDVGVVVGCGADGHASMTNFIGHPDTTKVVCERLIERSKEKADGQRMDAEASEDEVQPAE